MDFLSLESALLLQGGEPYYGYGWSGSDPTVFPSGIGGVGAMGGGSIVGHSSSVAGGGGGVGARGVSSATGGYGTGGYDRHHHYQNHHHHVVANNKLPATPLDPLLKYLKREYASSAGPQDILASTISTKELEFLLNETGDAAGPVGGKKPQPSPPATVIMMAEGEEIGPSPVVGRETEGRAAQINGVESAAAATASIGNRQPWVERPPVPATGVGEDVGRVSSWGDGAAARAATPLASGAGITAGGSRHHRAPHAMSTSASLHSSEQQQQQQLSPPHHAASATSAREQQRRRRQMPNFCRSPPSHIDNLLRTTPHLRHLSPASTDMSGAGVYDESKNIFAQLLNFKGKKSGGMSSTAAEINVGIGVDPALSSGAAAAAAIDYHTSLMRRRANYRASSELASFLRLLSDEMTQETFATVESEVYSKVFSLVHSKAERADDRLAGVAALEALLSVPSADEERRAIRFGNNLSNGLKQPAFADYEFLHAIARALGRMAEGAANGEQHSHYHVNKYHGHSILTFISLYYGSRPRRVRNRAQPGVAAERQERPAAGGRACPQRVGAVRTDSVLREDPRRERPPPRGDDGGELGDGRRTRARRAWRRQHRLAHGRAGRHQRLLGSHPPRFTRYAIALVCETIAWRSLDWIFGYRLTRASNPCVLSYENHCTRYRLWR
mmetsp:Transcript_15876/g.34203  ORF Transcript_15876/g.34203 Transcript_15876/m.34203 type:complete len:672 (+) Transcript_15876:322-2337(+)